MKVKCELCSKIIDLTNSSPANLVTHFNERHCKKENTHHFNKATKLISKSIQNQNQDSSFNYGKKLLDCSRIRSCDNLSKIKYKCTKQISEPCLFQVKNILGNKKTRMDTSFSERAIVGNNRVYKTSISKWKAGSGKVLCPNCGAVKRVIAKTMTFKKTTTPIESCCLLTCWPLVCLSFLFPAPEQEFLYCSNCQFFLGVYEPTTNCLKPNKQCYKIENSAGFIAH